MTTPPAAAGAGTVPFVTQLRSRPGIVTVGGKGGDRATVRVQLLEQWDTVAFDVRNDTPLSELKRAALAQFAVGEGSPDDYVLKLRGVEVEDEAVTLATSTARDGSIFLMANRRRQPVR